MLKLALHNHTLTDAADESMKSTHIKQLAPEYKSNNGKENKLYRCYSGTIHPSSISLKLGLHNHTVTGVADKTIKASIFKKYS